MSTILSGQAFINDVDIYDDFGAFLGEVRKGSRENLKAIFTPSKTKEQVGVDFRERTGVKYPKQLSMVNAERDVTLTFCIYAKTRAEWIAKYNAFVAFVKSGWLTVRFPTIGVELDVLPLLHHYAPLTYLWREGVQASHFREVREPEPTLLKLA